MRDYRKHSFTWGENISPSKGHHSWLFKHTAHGVKMSCLCRQTWLLLVLLLYWFPNSTTDYCLTHWMWANDHKRRGQTAIPQKIITKEIIRQSESPFKGKSCHLCPSSLNWIIWDGRGMNVWESMCMFLKWAFSDAKCSNSISWMKACQAKPVSKQHLAEEGDGWIGSHSNPIPNGQPCKRRGEELTKHSKRTGSL